MLTIQDAGRCECGGVYRSALFLGIYAINGVEILEVRTGKFHVIWSGVEDMNSDDFDERHIPDDIGATRIFRRCQSLGIRLRRHGAHKKQAQL